MMKTQIIKDFFYQYMSAKHVIPFFLYFPFLIFFFGKPHVNTVVMFMSQVTCYFNGVLSANSASSAFEPVDLKVKTCNNCLV